MSELDSKSTVDLEAEDIVVARALTMGSSYEAAGVLIGRSAKTIQRKMQDPEFRALVQRARSEYSEEVGALLVPLVPEAVGALRQLLESEDESVRLRAVSLALSWPLAYRRHGDLERDMREVRDLLRERRAS